MNLTLKGCYTMGFKGLSICLPLLSNLTLEYVHGSIEVFNIVAPQLKNLSISSFLQAHRSPTNHQYLLSVPNFVFLTYKGHYCLQLSTEGFLSLEKADICVSSPKDAHQVLRLLQHLHSVKSLTLNLEIVEVTEIGILNKERSITEAIMAAISEQRKAQADELIIADWYIDSCWNYLSMHIEKRKEKPSSIISKLTDIKELLEELPASNIATIQPSFSALCAEPDIVMNKLTECMKLHFDMNRRRLSVCCDELATSLQQLS
ncbi:hypothetical protein Hdeb2414_s0005g00184121 [Helianthus debilis subsp. tardiflorus]